MGDSKRRKENLGDQYGQEPNLISWLPIKKSQAQTIVQLSTRGAWIGIALLVAYWATVRFIGPSLGWWQLAD